MRRRNVDESRRGRERELLAAQPTYADVQRYAAELYRSSPDPFATGLELDRLLKASGHAGRYYAERLLSMIPRAWRKGPGPRGPDPAHPHRLTEPYAPLEGPHLTLPDFPAPGSPSPIFTQNFSTLFAGTWQREIPLYSQIPELVFFVDRPQEWRDKAQLDRFPSRSRVNMVKPYLGLNTPDGFGDPAVIEATPGSTFGSGLTRMTTIGIEVGYRPGLTAHDARIHDYDRNSITLSGAGELEVRGAHYYGFNMGLATSVRQARTPGPQRRVSRARFHKLRPGWSDASFLKLATLGYNDFVERAQTLGPIAALTQREESARRRATGGYPDLTPGDWEFADSQRGRLDRELIAATTRAGEIAGLPPFPWWTGSGAYRLRPLRAQDYTPEVLACWHEVLESVIASSYHAPGEEPPEPPVDPRLGEDAPWMHGG